MSVFSKEELEEMLMEKDPPSHTRDKPKPKTPDHFHPEDPKHKDKTKPEPKDPRPRDVPPKPKSDRWGPLKPGDRPKPKPDVIDARGYRPRPKPDFIQVGGPERTIVKKTDSKESYSEILTPIAEKLKKAAERGRARGARKADQFNTEPSKAIDDGVDKVEEGLGDALKTVGNKLGNAGQEMKQKIQKWDAKVNFGQILHDGGILSKPKPDKKDGDEDGKKDGNPTVKKQNQTKPNITKLQPPQPDPNYDPNKTKGLGESHQINENVEPHPLPSDNWQLQEIKDRFPDSTHHEWRAHDHPALANRLNSHAVHFRNNGDHMVANFHDGEYTGTTNFTKQMDDWSRGAWNARKATSAIHKDLKNKGFTIKK